jgi:hypothetical protein
MMIAGNFSAFMNAQEEQGQLEPVPQTPKKVPIEKPTKPLKRASFDQNCE